MRLADASIKSLRPPSRAKKTYFDDTLADGTLLWYKHIGYASGVKSWSGPRLVIGAMNGSIYAVNQSGDLLFYKHIAWANGDQNWEGPITLASGWNKYLYMFSNLGGVSGEPPPPAVN